MNAASRLTLQLAMAAAAGYAGAAYHLHAHWVPAQPRPAGMFVQTSGGGAMAAPFAGRAIGASYREAALRAGASVVTVYCAGAGTAPSAVAVASGVVVDRDGLVVTTAEVAGQSDTVVVVLPDGTHRNARFLGADPAGLALLKVEGAALNAIEIGAPDAAAVGDPVLALGDALGLGPTVTQGIISAIHPAKLQGSSERADLIQTDAAIHPGNFGGALVDAGGRLVGITVGTVGGGGAAGFAVAVPADLVVKVMAKLRQASHAEPAQRQLTPERGGRFTEVSYPTARGGA